MMDHKSVEEYLLGMPNAKLDYPFGKEAAVYKVGGFGTESLPTKGHDKMFAIIAEGSNPVRISLKCDPQLSLLLRDKYESVMPGYHLNKKHWNTIILSGQLPWEEIQGFIRRSYNLVVGEKSDLPKI